MVRRMTRCPHHGDGLAIHFKDVAIGEHPIRRIISIERCISAWADRLQRQRRAANNRCTSAPANTRDADCIAMRVGAHNRGNRTTGDCVDQRVDMLRQVRAGINHRDLPLAYNSLRPVVGESGRIVREHTAMPGSNSSSFAYGASIGRGSATVGALT